LSFSKSFLDELKSRFRPSDVIGRHVKLTRAGREFKGLSPFTNEKSPSFFVNDQKGFYHCFSSGEHGDIIKFLQQVRGLSFQDAVKQLADEAGMELPKQSPQEREREQRRATLVDIMDMASKFYERNLRQSSGAEGLDYFRRRGLTESGIERFRLGFAERERTALHDHLLQKDVAPDQMEEAGLIIRPDDGRPAYDRFRHRVMFPIEDSRGRVIAFGGRALDKDVPAKYLNSPDTPLFQKGLVLYNYAKARDAAYRHGQSGNDAVVVAEGYMDVIALSEAGFESAVAPLGTALTERQIELLWRICPEPILSFDGDRAGIGAAHRVIDRALPLLKPGHSLRFALMPQGRDPDDVIQSGGSGAMSKILEAAQPLADMLWDRELAAAPHDTPERRAGLESRLQSHLREIQNGQIRDYYQAEFRSRIKDLFSAPGAGAPNRTRGSRDFGNRRGGRGPEPGISPELRRSALVRAPEAHGDPRERLLVGTILNHPGILESHFETFAKIDFGNRKLDTLRNEIIRIAASGEPLERSSLDTHLMGTESAGLAKDLRQQIGTHSEPFARPDASLSDAERGWCHLLHLHESLNALQKELRDAEEALARETNDENWARFVAVKAQLRDSEQTLADFTGDAA